MPDQSVLSSYQDADFLPPAATSDVPHEEQERNLRLHSATFESVWRVMFHVMDDTLMLPRAMDVNVQIVRDARYRHPCRDSQSVHYRYFCYTLSGVGGFWDASGTYSVPAGHAFLVEKDNAEAGYFYPKDAREPWRFLGFTFDGISAQAMARSLIQRYGPIFVLPSETPILQRLQSYRGEGERVTNIQMTDGAQMVIEVLLALLAAGQAKEETAPGNLLIRQAITIMTADGDMSVQDAARQIGVSREHLSRTFQKRYGMSPRQFCLKQRINKACILLKSTDLPIKAIARQMGYTEYPNFASAFRQVTSMTPGEFRERGVLPLAFTLWDERKRAD